MVEVSLERICDHVSILRVGGSFGKPYRWHTTVIRTSETVWELKGLNHEVTLGDFHAIRDFVKPLGIKQVKFDRYDEDGNRVTHVLDVK